MRSILEEFGGGAHWELGRGQGPSDILLKGARGGKDGHEQAGCRREGGRMGFG
jgi:hypothetical protein